MTLNRPMAERTSARPPSVARATENITRSVQALGQCLPHGPDVEQRTVRIDASNGSGDGGGRLVGTPFVRTASAATRGGVCAVGR